MNIQGWAEIVVTIGLSIALGWPLGIYMARVWQDQPTWLSPVMRPVETVFYRLSGVDKDKGQTALGYTLSFLAFSAAAFVFLYAILRLQGVLPLNPQHFAGMYRCQEAGYMTWRHPCPAKLTCPPCGHSGPVALLSVSASRKKLGRGRAWPAEMPARTSSRRWRAASM